MTARRTYILACGLLAAALCRADSAGSAAPAPGPITSGPITPGPVSSDSLTAAQYRAELDGLLSATRELDSSGNPTPQLLNDVPPSWRVQLDRREFEISAEGLRRDVRRYEKEKNAANASAIRARLRSLRSDLDGYERPPVDVSASRAELNSILARPEFRGVEGPNWFDRLRQRLLEFIFGLLEKLFRSASFPTVGRFFVYGLMGLAGIALIYFAYRAIWSNRELEKVIPTDLPVSAKEWVVWLSEARAAAAKREWRDAIHLAYWAGISFLERQGMWKPDRARTPREYLRLLGANEYRETLTALTRIFELAWYANRGASERSFSETLQELEKLGCR
jgi:hypothetical protein